MEKKIIDLTNENYIQYLPLDPIAFSFAEGGAMGSPGQIIIVDNNHAIYRFNIVDFERRIVNDIIPALYETQSRVPQDQTSAMMWHYFSLGMGNHLMVKDSIYNEFSFKAREYRWHIGELYQKWLDLVLEII